MTNRVPNMNVIEVKVEFPERDDRPQSVCVSLHNHSVHRIVNRAKDDTATFYGVQDGETYAVVSMHGAVVSRMRTYIPKTGKVAVVAKVDATKFKAMTFNIQSNPQTREGTAFEGGRIAAIIDNQLAYDDGANHRGVVALQEVYTEKLGEVIRALGDRGIVMKHAFVRAAKTIHEKYGEYGNAILWTRQFELRSEGHWDLPNGDDAHGKVYEQRALLRVTLRLHGNLIRVYCTHLHAKSGDSLRKRQINMVLDEANSLVGSRLIMGDLNMAPSVVERIFRARGYHEVDNRDEKTTGGRKFDYIFYRGLHRISSDVPGTSASDHRPLVAELRIKKKS